MPRAQAEHKGVPSHKRHMEIRLSFEGCKCYSNGKKKIALVVVGSKRLLAFQVGETI